LFLGLTGAPINARDAWTWAWPTVSWRASARS
jgi:hypothetical protein